MNNQSVRLLCEPLYTLGEASISGTYALIGQILNPSQLFWVQNLTNATLTYSFDGVTDNFQLPAGGFVILDVGTNHGTSLLLSLQQGTALFTKGSPSSGQTNLTTFYMG